MHAAKGGELHHFDAEQAFLKTNIDEEIYIKIPEEYQEFPGAVGLLNKVIYGLIQAGRCWNIKFCNDMAAIGFEQSKTDPCVFRKIADEEVGMVVVVHVDDILAHAKDQATRVRLAAELGEKFQVRSMVEKFGVEKARRTPASLGVPIFLQVDEPQTLEEEEYMFKLPNQEAVWALMWRTAMTRPDIAYAVRAVARFRNPGLTHC